MTIGPEPMTRMCLMSARFGIRPGPPLWIFLRQVGPVTAGAGRSRGPAHGTWIFLRQEGPVTASAGRSSDRSLARLQQLDESIEQVRGVVPSGSRFRVVLDAERPCVQGFQALDHVVVQAHVAH